MIHDNSEVCADRTGLDSPGCDGVVCLAAVDWWYHNRGHSECQLMKRLAARLPVLWINSIGMRAPMPGKTSMFLTRYWRKLKSQLRGLRRDDSGMWVYSPLFIPRYTPRMIELNGWLLRLQIRALCARIGIRRPAVFATLPTTAPVVECGRFARVVFNRSDLFSSFREANADVIMPLEDRLLRAADSVLYVNRGLFERERDRSRHALYLGHGVDFAHFGRAMAAETNGVADRVRQLARPIVGYYGALDDYTIDLPLLVKVARRIPNGTLLLIGPCAMDLAPLLREPNVTYLGPVPYRNVPAYAAHFDVAIMPWRQNEWIANCNPIKLKEYLAIGFPIVTMRFGELAPYEHLVYAADTHDQFLDGIESALGERDDSRIRARRDAVAADSWDRLAERVGTLLGIPQTQVS